MAVPHVEHADAAGEIEVLAAVHVAQADALRALGEDRMGGGHAAGDGGLPSLEEGVASHGPPRRPVRRAMRHGTAGGQRAISPDSE